MRNASRWYRFIAVAALAALVALGALAGTEVPGEEFVAPVYASPTGSVATGRAGYAYNNTTPVSITDSYCTTGVQTSTITVPDSFYIAEMTVGLCVTHTYRGDLEFRLRGPDGTVVQLIADQGAGADNLSALFDDAAAGTIDTANQSTAGCQAVTPLFEVTVRPLQPLSAFATKLATGTWTLELCDDAGGDVGTLHLWTLNFESVEGIAILPVDQSTAGCPGDPSLYNFTLFNATGAPVTADMTYTSVYPFSGPATVGPVADGASAPFSVEVTPPSTAAFPDADILTATATSGAYTSSATATTGSILFGGFVDEAPLGAGRGVRYHSVVHYNGKLYKIGGEDGTVRAYLDIYDMATNTWSAGTDMTAARMGIKAVEIGGKIYVAGGGPTTSTASNTLYIYDPALNSWTTGANLPANRVSYAGAAVGGKYYVIGGGTSSSTYLNTIYAYDPATNTWDTTLPNMTSARLNAMAGVIGGKIYVVGGRSASSTFVNTVEIFDPTTGTWSMGTNLPTTGWVYGAEGVVSDRFLVLAGGYTATATASAYYLVYDAIGSVWYVFIDLSHMLYGSAGVGVGDIFWFVSGRIYEGGVFSYSLYNTHSTGCAVPPTAVDDTYSTLQDVPLIVTAPGVLTNDTDPDGLPLTAEPFTSPANGAVTLNPDGSLAYTPNAGYSGADTFTYRCTNGTLYSDPATVTINVTPLANTPPVANPDTYSTLQGQTLTVAAPGVLANDTDAQGDSLTAIKVTDPANGILSAFNADGSFTYVPNAGFAGTDTFTYKANDGLLDSNVTTVTIDVCSFTCFATATPSGTTVPITVTFTADVTIGAPCVGVATYAWDFGDGTTDTVQNPTHVYATGGSYTWTMTATVDGVTCTQTGILTAQAFDLTFFDDYARSQLCVNSTTGDFAYTILRGFGIGTYTGTGIITTYNGQMLLRTPAGLPYSLILKYLDRYYKATANYTNRPARVYSSLIDNNTLNNPPVCDIAP